MVPAQIGRQPMTITPTYKIAHAAGQDAGNASAHVAGRIKWNAADWDAAAQAMTRLLAMEAD